VGLVWLWDLATVPAEPKVLEGHLSDIQDIAFSADDQWIATGSADGSVRLWDPSASDPSDSSFVLWGHEKAVEQGPEAANVNVYVVFSADNRWLATAGCGQRGPNQRCEQGSVQLWNVLDTELGSVELSTHKDVVYQAAFSADGHWLLTQSPDEVPQLWDMHVDDLITQACELVGRNLSLEEWEEYFPGEDYYRTCEQWGSGESE
jgi:WD40 repeat protein